MRQSTIAILVILGPLVTDFAPLACAQAESAILSSWTRTADLSLARAQSCAATLNDGRVLVMGGLGLQGPVAAVDIYGTDGRFAQGPCARQHVRRRYAGGFQ